MGYVITNHERVITERFDTQEDLNLFLLSAQQEEPAENSGSNQYVRIDDEEMNTRFNNSDEIGKSFFYFIYTTEQFENLSGV